jgi:lysozyme family protein
MSADNFPECFALTLKYEGGFVNDPHDPGGATNMGITRDTLSAYFGRAATVNDVRHLKLDTVQRIYHLNYWNAVRGDDLPAGVDLAVYDFAVHSGVHRAIIGMQRALGIADDGKLGPITLQSVRTTSAQNTIMGICADRFEMMRKLSTWHRYANGWTARVNSVMSSADAMAAQQKAHGK